MAITELQAVKIDGWKGRKTLRNRPWSARGPGMNPTRRTLVAGDLQLDASTVEEITSSRSAKNPSNVFSAGKGTGLSTAHESRGRRRKGNHLESTMAAAGSVAASTTGSNTVPRESPEGTRARAKEGTVTTHQVPGQKKSARSRMSGSTAFRFRRRVRLVSIPCPGMDHTSSQKMSLMISSGRIAQMSCPCATTPPPGTTRCATRGVEWT